MRADKQCMVDTGADGFMVVKIDFLRDKRLSAKAMGVLAFMLSCSEEWDYSINGISKCMADGRDAVRSAVKELEELGYVRRETVKSENDGTFSGVRYFIRPYTENTSSAPMTENPSSDNPSSDNTTQSNINQSNINQSPTCNNQTTPDRDGHEGGTNERARARESREEPQGPHSSPKFDYLIESIHRDFREAYPDVPLRYQNESFLEREREIVAEAAEAAGDGVGRWREDVLRALRNPDFRKWLMDSRRGDWCPTLGNVLASGDWQRFSTEGKWL